MRMRMSAIVPACSRGENCFALDAAPRCTFEVFMGEAFWGSGYIHAEEVLISVRDAWQGLVDES
jgi:hypothetical protein